MVPEAFSRSAERRLVLDRGSGGQAAGRGQDPVRPELRHLRAERVRAGHPGPAGPAAGGAHLRAGAEIRGGHGQWRGSGDVPGGLAGPSPRGHRGGPGGRQRAERTFELVQKYAADTANGGYREMFLADWQPRPAGPYGGDRKSFDVHMHLMEAYTALYELSGAEIHQIGRASCRERG